MTDNTVIPEIDVLVATSLWLYRRKLLPYQFSIARGRGIDGAVNKEHLRAKLAAAGLPSGFISFTGDGPDVVAISKTEWWQVECKGVGTGKSQTQRNNFDRALASVVSYYGAPLPELPEEFHGLPEAQPRLGLAIPAARDYLRELNRRVRAPLRQRLNLWVLLYEPSSGEIRAVSPEDSY
jgi:hypothetical protein